MEQVNKLVELANVAKVEMEAFTAKGNASAGARARKALQEIAVLCKSERKAIQDAKNAKKVK